MKTLLSTNKQGHNKALWDYFVKGTPRRRDWYARGLRARQGEIVRTREQIAKGFRERGLEPLVRSERGFRVFEPGAFGEIDEIAALAKQLVTDGENAQRARGNKDFLQQGLLANEALTSESPFVRFALREDVIAGIASYLGVVPVLEKMDVWKSDNSAAENRASQLYHCDWDDRTQIKIFVYASDVDRASGPLTLMEAEASDTLRERQRYTYGRKGYRVSDADANKVVPASRQHEITGKAGTAVFADTSRCFHFGSRVREGARPRIVGFFQFVTPTSFLYPPAGYRDVAPYRHLADTSHSQLQQMVLGAV